MPDDIDNLAAKTAKIGIDVNLEEWYECSPEVKLEHIKKMDLNSRKIAQNRSLAFPSENIVKLNIGGTKFETSKSTLTKFNGMFKTMLETEIPIPKDDSGYLFIDRDPRQFHVILNFMRAGKIEFPNSMQEVKEIQNEAEYYQMTGLEEMCKAKIREMTETKSVFDENVQVLETDAQLLQVITEPKKPVLIIYYHIDSGNRTMIPKGFSIKTFMECYKHKMNIFFRSFTDLDDKLSDKPTNWLWSLHYDTYSFYNGTITKGHWPTVLKRSISRFFAENDIAL